MAAGHGKTKLARHFGIGRAPGFSVPTHDFLRLRGSRLAAYETVIECVLPLSHRRAASAGATTTSARVLREAFESLCGEPLPDYLFCGESRTQHLRRWGGDTSALSSRWVRVPEPAVSAH